MIARHHQYAAEAFATFCLTGAVLATLTQADLPMSTPIAAAITLVVMVFVVGKISGAHLNPAITIALASQKKINLTDAIFYIAAQVLGAAAAMFLMGWMLKSVPEVATSDDLTVFAAEALGAAVLAFGVTTAVRNNNYETSGFIIGGALFAGIALAAGASNAVLNPAVAVGIGSISATYIIAPIVGALGGAWLNAWLYGDL